MQIRTAPLPLLITALLLAACGGNGGQPPLPEQSQTPYVPDSSHKGNGTQQSQKEEQKQEPSKPAPAPSPAPSPAPKPSPNPTPNPPSPPPATTRNLSAQDIHSAVAAASDAAYLQPRIQIVKADGKLQMGRGEYVSKPADHTGYDAGMNALKNGVSDINPLFGGVNGFIGNTAAVFFRDPAVTGWSYQTFGQFFVGNNDAAYLSIGQTFTPEDTAAIKATYQGIAMGTYDNASEVIANMTAELDWSGAQKTLALKVYDSKIAENNAALKQYQGIKDDARFDFNETLNWSSANQRFESATTHGHLYGADAAEVGGTWGKTVDGKVYNGAFGGKKQ